MVNNQRGGASLIIVTLTAVLLSVLTVAGTKLMTGEFRQAIDAENGIKSYYAAEGSAEESVASLKAAIDAGVALPLLNQNCDRDGVPTRFTGAPPWPALASDSVTCRKIRTTTDFLENDKIKLSGVRHYDLSKNYFDRIELTWDQDPVPTALADRVFNNSLVDPLNATSLHRNTPALIEITRIVYADSDSGPATRIVAGGASTKSLILVPDSAVPGAYKAATGGSGVDCGDVGDRRIKFDSCFNEDGGTVKVLCDVGTGHRCAATITDFIPAIAAGDPQKRVILRIRPFFKPLTYNMALYQNLDKITFMLDAAEIDITAKVGDSYRRIIQNFDLTANPPRLDAIFGDFDVCKDFRIKSDAPVGEDVDDEPERDQCAL